MAKAGSTSIQRWLAGNLGLLREREIRVVRVAAPSPTTVVERHVSPQAVQSQLTYQFFPPKVGQRATARADHIVRQLIDIIDRCAVRDRTVVLSGEAFETIFWHGDPVILSAFDELATRHDVRVAYYVRPQHTSMEANWCQWGFRHRKPPSAYLRSRIPHLEYLRTLEQARAHAPHVSFEMRPLRHDLLEGGDAVIDFAKLFLGIEGVASDTGVTRWSNRSLPLDLAVLLRDAPNGLLWTSLHDNRFVERVKEILGGNEITESDMERESRALLQRFCYRTFEADNQAVIAMLGWHTDHFVPSLPEPREGEPLDDLSRLDDLWRSTSSDAERQIVFRVLHGLLSAVPVDESPMLDSP